MDCCDRESAVLARYAMFSRDTAGRVYEEPPHPYRGPYQRDRDRVVHSSAFRRLAHKTQVFTGDMGDYHRTRLTHTLEVASIARTVGRALRLNEDLIETLALMHDIGHPPFGHAGEDVLDECLADEGGFDHNAQALRIVETLEQRYPDFPGLNLSREVLAGQRVRADKIAEPPQLPLLEVQVVDAADSIAYDAHDADDAVELGLLELSELAKTSLWNAAGNLATRRYSGLNDQEYRQATVRELLSVLVGDLVTASQERLSRASPDSSREAMAHGQRLVGVSSEVAEEKKQLEALLFSRVYRHPAVLEQRTLAVDALRDLFHTLCSQPAVLPASWQQRVETSGLRRTVADYLAGMTDRFAWEEYGRLTSPADSQSKLPDL